MSIKNSGSMLAKYRSRFQLYCRHGDNFPFGPLHHYLNKTNLPSVCFRHFLTTKLHTQTRLVLSPDCWSMIHKKTPCPPPPYFVGHAGRLLHVFVLVMFIKCSYKRKNKEWYMVFMVVTQFRKQLSFLWTSSTRHSLKPIFQHFCLKNILWGAFATHFSGTAAPPNSSFFLTFSIKHFRAYLEAIPQRIDGAMPLFHIKFQSKICKKTVAHAVGR